MFKAGKNWLFVSMTSVAVWGSVFISTSMTANADTAEVTTTNTQTATQGTPATDAAQSSTAASDVQATTPAKTESTTKTTDEATGNTEPEQSLVSPTQSATAATTATNSITSSSQKQVTLKPVAIKATSASILGTPKTDVADVANEHVDLLIGQSQTTEPAEVNVNGESRYMLGATGRFDIDGDKVVAGASFAIANLSMVADASGYTVPLQSDGASIGGSVVNQEGRSIGSVTFDNGQLNFRVADNFSQSDTPLLGMATLYFNGPWMMVINYQTPVDTIRKMPFSNTLQISSLDGTVLNSYKFNFSEVNVIPLDKWLPTYLVINSSAADTRVNAMQTTEVIPNVDVLRQLQASGGQTGDTVSKSNYQFAYHVSADHLFKFKDSFVDLWGFVANSDSKELVRIDRPGFSAPWFVKTGTRAEYQAKNGATLQELEALNFDGAAYSLQSDGSYLFYFNLPAAEVSVKDDTLNTKQSVEASFDTSFDAASQATHDYYMGAMAGIPPVFQPVMEFDFENEYIPNTVTMDMLDLNTGATIDSKTVTSVPNQINLNGQSLAVYHYIDADSGEVLHTVQLGSYYTPDGTNLETAPATEISGYELLTKVPDDYQLPVNAEGTAIAADTLEVSRPQTANLISNYYLLYQTSREVKTATKTVTQTIHYLDAQDHSHVLSRPKTQTLNFAENALYEDATGDLLGYDTDGDRRVNTTVADEGWLPSEQSFTAVQSPDLTNEGYGVASQPTVAATAVSAAAVTDGQQFNVDVYYDHGSSDIKTETKTVTRTITYVDANTRQMVANTVTQPVELSRTITTDAVTKAVTTSAWTVTAGAYAAVNSPDLSTQGYGPASQNVDAVTVNGDTTDMAVEVLYEHRVRPTNEVKTVTRTIHYLDRQTNAVLAELRTQQAAFTRTSSEDLVTHVVTTTDWQPEKANLLNVTSPDLTESGYQTPSQVTVGPLTVTPTSGDVEVNVYYDKVTSPAQPSQPTERSEPTTSVTPTQPVQPVAPTTPTTPSTPVQPTTSVTPTQPVTPNESIEPTLPVNRIDQTVTPRLTEAKQQANSTIGVTDAEAKTLIQRNQTQTPMLPQTNESQSVASLIGLGLVTVLTGLGVQKKKRRE
ncbi:cell surface protein precursor [Secundilactobacillus odoratitofui DSM 19909 = JCM 15043]|uniref:Cell surface protein n=3 Tax=Secundilactobacillus odoratitofui TaxID=480930 RepID=A0A0R1LPL8_9LACO|nr:cell surface protein precursor [Secundilactobacillus odoratitofui DSM 19909 = JCM 15043]